MYIEEGQYHQIRGLFQIGYINVKIYSSHPKIELNRYRLVKEKSNPSSFIKRIELKEHLKHVISVEIVFL